MTPQLFSILNADMAVKALLGSNPLRVYPSRAPDNPTLPYAVYTVYNANPENYINGAPDMDNKGTQIDIYGQSGVSVAECFEAIRSALEGAAHMTNYSTPVQDADTDFFSCRMEFDFWEAV